jgi:hypothetical protein
MKKSGIAFITIGFYLALLAFNMDVVVGTTYNIGLLNDRQNIVYLSGIIFLAGIILFGFGFVAKEESKNLKLFSVGSVSLPIMLLIGIKTISAVENSQRAEKYEKEQREEEEEKRYRILREQQLGMEKIKEQAEISLPKENLKFIDNSNGTVTHKASGLIWQKCSVGQSWDGTTCLDDAKKFTWDDAKKLKSDFAGKTDWRLPTKNELMLLVYCSDEQYNSDGSCTSSASVIKPTISGTHFPNTQSSWFWSSSPYAGSSDLEWGVGFFNGNSDFSLKYDDGYVRLVRSGQ